MVSSITAILNTVSVLVALAGLGVTAFELRAVSRTRRGNSGSVPTKKVALVVVLFLLSLSIVSLYLVAGVDASLSPGSEATPISLPALAGLVSICIVFIEHLNRKNASNLRTN
ncbi:hypothetical protein [Halorussus aquaticus]|uniref:Uncharacterized protein n=1 Tax=Halorussus aquaticus TaxID=2953748 RepID=A0ABD5PWV6_9EURY|nr:hypothetical protein [Halorussus aquaticus]